MFDHPLFERYDFERIPLNRDLYLMDEKWMAAYEAAWLRTFAGQGHENVGLISFAAARRAGEHALELSWFPNVFDRFHEVRVSLACSDFVVCVGCAAYDEKPHIFVKRGWFEQLYLRAYSVFALIDAIGVKLAINRGELSRAKLVLLRDEIDALVVKI